ncbi:L-seryl-tRNA(Sec) selenium transferase [Mediannikoviicoccus vaginalis]|uniref:L-seryl-tRNA(Sec) selenium transferase n=1 Tax=Mediannikoviicoccus vaginalis TaxID=2899727 RepID=UPI001F009170|nr:L-seryl-tRNA(Sec) selenium transferase [Mediannikoviicoccus vaginalis]
MQKKDLFKKIPQVEEILKNSRIEELDYSRTLKTKATREVLEDIRNKIIHCNEDEVEKLSTEINDENIIIKVEERLYREFSPSLLKVINGTGTILHTNLGRSLLDDSIKEDIWNIISSYSNLEYDIAEGKRGSRYSHVTKMIKLLFGVEDALIVNNNAAAVFLVLNTFAKDKEAIVSRGELVEVGGAFRIPSVMAMSGANLVEVGSTNKTRVEDYEEAITEETAVLMKVHTSNYKLIGFTDAVSNKELKELGDKYDIPVMEDLGSGVYFNMEEYGLPHEPTISESIKSGIDLITFSGDKLLGGPQAGIIVGKKEYIDKMKKNQILRALRVDKFTLAALECTIRMYFDEEKAKKHIPTIRMITLTPEELFERAEVLKEKIDGRDTRINVYIEDGKSTVGGGSMPGEEFDSKVIVLTGDGLTADKIEETLRLSSSHIIGRIKDDKYMLDLRTLNDKDFDRIAEEIENCFPRR